MDFLSRFRYRSKLMIVFGTLVVISCIITGGFVYYEKQNSLYENLQNRVYQFTAINTRNIIEAYTTFYNTSFVDFQKHIKDAQNLIGNDISRIQIYKYDGTLVYDSVEEKEFQYSSDIPRTVEKGQMFEAIQGVTTFSKVKKSDITVDDMISPEQKIPTGWRTKIRKAIEATHPAALEYIVIPYIGQDNQHKYSVVYHIDYTDVYKAIRLVVFFMVAGAGTVLFVLFVLVALLSNFLTGPLKKLESAVNAFGRGEWDVRPPKIEGKDEVAQLSTAFAQMMENIQEAEREKLEKEKQKIDIEKAKEIAEIVSPKTIPPIEGLELHASIESMESIGGDFYDAFPIPGKQEYILYLGDVSGHGVPAGLLGAMANIMIYTHVQSYPEATLSELMILANTTIKKKAPSGYYATILIAHWNPTTRELRYLVCGHPEFYYYTAATQSLNAVSKGGFPIGLIESPMFHKNARFQEQTLTLAPGDIFAFHTDGINEAENTRTEQYGVDRYTQSLLRHITSQSDIKNIFQGVKDDLLTFRDSEPAHDDISLIIGKVL